MAKNHRVDFVASIGGYYNLEHAIEFSFSGVHGNSKRQSHEWGRLIFALNHVEALTDEPDRDLLRQALALGLQLKEKEMMEFESRLSPAGQTLLSGIRKGLTEQQLQSFRQIARARENETRDLSPQTFLETIDRKTKIYLLHGTSDDSIPFEESLELQDAAVKAGFQTHCLITTGLTHVDVTSAVRMWESLRLLHWTRLLLSEA